MYYVYIITNANRNVIYTGVTNNIFRRMYEHKNGINEGFSKRYHLKILLYYEMYEEIERAILREKQIKSWSRKKKVELIDSRNIDWNDLYEEIKE